MMNNGELGELIARNSAAIHALEELIEEKFRARDEALFLQAQEYTRRLEELNHAHSRAVETLATYIPREIYESELKDMRTRLGGLEKLAAAAEGIGSYKRWFWGAIFLAVSVFAASLWQLVNGAG